MNCRKRSGAYDRKKARAEINELTERYEAISKRSCSTANAPTPSSRTCCCTRAQGSGEHRVVDINALVEESLNLAYHGARAEKQGFNITMERSFDPTAGEVDLFPQEITRVLLNLISNGFYAATKRKKRADHDGYEPTLAASTQSLGDQVEIRIRDNGTGIPPEVKEKMFNPFFTTKPAGEGTGLGLSISHDIIVKQHGGAIEVDTQPGEYTEFRIVLPRKSAIGWQDRRGGVNLLILVVDDEPDVEMLFRAHFRRDLREGRFTMEFAQSGETALQRIADAGGVSLILILSDINMPGMTGLELLPKAKAARPDVPVIMITAYGDATPSARHWKAARKRFSPNPSTLARSVAKSIRASNGPRSRRTRLVTPDRNVRFWPLADIVIASHMSAYDP